MKIKKIKKNNKKQKGGIIDVFINKDIDILSIIDCIIRKKAEKIASYYFLLHNKEINNIDDFLTDLLPTIITYITNLTFVSFKECMIDLLQRFIVYKYNPNDQDTRKFLYLGNLIYKLNNEKNNINFGNYGSEAHILYCIDNPNKILRNKCYYNDILDGYLKYYSDLPEETKKNDKDKKYTMEDIFKKIGFDIAIYIHVFVKNNFNHLEFEGFSEQTKTRIINNFTDILKNEFKSLFKKSTEGDILSTILKDEELKQLYEKEKNEGLEDEEKNLFEQKKYNLYKYGILEFKGCSKKIREFASFKNSVLMNPNESVSLQNASKLYDEYRKKYSPKQNLQKGVSPAKKRKPLGSSLQNASKLYDEYKNKYSPKQNLQTGVSPSKQRKPLGSSSKLKKDDSPDKLPSSSKTSFSKSNERKKLGESQETSKTFLPKNIFMSITFSEDKDKKKLAEDFFEIFKSQTKDKKLLYEQSYFVLKDFSDKFRNQFRKSLREETFDFSANLKLLFESIDELREFEKFQKVFELVFKSELDKLKPKELIQFYILHQNIIKKILKSIDDTNDFNEILKLQKLLKTYLFFFNLLRDDLLISLKKLKSQIKIKKYINSIISIEFKKINELYLIGFTKLCILGHLEGSKIFLSLFTSIFKPNQQIQKRLLDLSSQSKMPVLLSKSPLRRLITKPTEKPLLIMPLQSPLKRTISSLSKRSKVSQISSEAIKSFVARKENITDIPTDVYESSELELKPVTEKSVEEISTLCEQMFLQFKSLAPSIISCYIPKKRCENSLVSFYTSQNIKLFVSMKSIDLLLKNIQQSETQKLFYKYKSRFHLLEEEQKTLATQLVIKEKDDITTTFIQYVNEYLQTQKIEDLNEFFKLYSVVFGSIKNYKIKKLEYKPQMKPYSKPQEEKKEENILKFLKIEKDLMKTVFQKNLQENKVTSMHHQYPSSLLNQGTVFKLKDMLAKTPLTPENIKQIMITNAENNLDTSEEIKKRGEIIKDNILNAIIFFKNIMF